MSIVVYGIKNCNSMKKAFLFLEEHDIAFRFHDFKKEGLELHILESILQKVGLEVLINTKGTTYKKLKDQNIQEITTAHILQNLSIIKRPLIVCYKGEAIEKVLIGLQHLEELL